MGDFGRATMNEQNYQELYTKLMTEVERLLSKAHDDYAYPMASDETIEDHAGYAYSELWVYLAHALFELSDCAGDELAILIVDIAQAHGVALSPTNKLRITWSEDEPAQLPPARIPVVGVVIDHPQLGNSVVFTNGGPHNESL